MRVVIACGGTGGHISPGLAIAEALRERDPRTEILFIGGRGLESRLVPQAGWTFHSVAAGQVARRRPLQALVALAAIAAGTVQSLLTLRRARPHAVVVTGGYAAAPVGAAAVLLRIPLVLQEQNLFPGAVNRLLGRWARAISIPHPQAAEHFPAGTIATGVPIRRQALGGDRARGLTRFGLDPGRLTILVLGGSQGAQSLNAAMVDAAPRLRDPASVQVLHQTGKTHEEWVRARLGQVRAPRYVPLGYIEDVADAYACADLVICRAGASTLGEVTAHGLPAVLVPYPYAAAGHQDANAGVLERAGAAVVLADRDLSGSHLAETIDRLRAAPGRLAAMAEASRRLGRPDAAAQVAELIARIDA